MRRYGLESFDGLVDAFEALPGIGKKTAQRLALEIVTGSRFLGAKLSHAIDEAVGKVRRCVRCRYLSEDELCSICADEQRDRELMCIVQSVKDVFSIEESGSYRGMYYIVETIEDLDEHHLMQAIEGVKEVIFAFAPSIASDTMILYIEEKLSKKPLRFSKIAQGVPTGVSLENIDTISLARALEARTVL